MQNSKKTYKPVNLEVVVLEIGDVITTSGTIPGSGIEDDPNTDSQW